MNDQEAFFQSSSEFKQKIEEIVEGMGLFFQSSSEFKCQVRHERGGCGQLSILF